MKAINKILVPVDLSENSVNTVQQAIDIANRSHAQIILLHVYSRPLFHSKRKKIFERSFFQTLEKGMLKWREKRVQTRFNTLMRSTSKMYDVKFTIIKAKGILIDKIKEVIKDFGVDLVIMGTKMGKKKKDLWNTKISRLSSHIKIPLLVLPYCSEMTKPVRIGFACDLKKITDFEELNIIKIFSSLYHAEVHLFTVKTDATLTKEELKNLDTLREYFDGYAPIVHTVKDSDVENGILHYLHNHGITMVTILHRSRNMLQRIMHKSVAKKIALNSDVPVLRLDEN